MVRQHQTCTEGPSARARRPWCTGGGWLTVHPLAERLAEHLAAANCTGGREGESPGNDSSVLTDQCTNTPAHRCTAEQHGPGPFCSVVPKELVVEALQQHGQVGRGGVLDMEQTV